ncbi:hypothetical protein [Parabacteroides chinchillae]|uniref:Tetratricopeptide repeat-containing protein n=1 Tax=Parabacteroides chinchillae TaxID=871327 RepID=A0A8G2BTG7_9BACT|nr:hypothetical protein [Parabacteroides chinchillae]SEF40540.1 hypothetical protein SAMN05444001_10140 [Parabacteroides chinchillae]
MNKASSLVILVNSLTKAEKRYFRLYANLQNGEKVYLSLFNLLDKKLSMDEVYTHFCKEQNGCSFDMAVKHLYRVILDCLIKLREKQNIQTEIFNYISKADILFERALFDDSFTELEKAKKLATAYENDPLLLLIFRTEIRYLSTLNFEGVSERKLVTKQMKIQETMKYSRNVNMHRQLYDILKHRLIYKGYSRSDKQKEDLNDLVLSELNLIANSSYKGFEATKLHLLFQATYYLNSGNYKSAIRHYQELINLFEKNKHLILNPPIYYVSAIHGILDSLHTAGLYKEMPFFLTKLKELENKDYPTEFVLDIKARIFQYELASFQNTGDFKSAKKLIDNHEECLIKKSDLLELEAQLKLYTNIAIFYLSCGDIPNAKKKIKKIFSSGKLFYALPSYKIARLINLLLQAELGNYDFLISEISSIKRNISFEKQVYITEKLIFRFVQAYPLPSYKKMQNKLWAHYQKDISKIKQDKYERHLLKTFDFLSWIESKLTNRPFAEILQEKAS